ncbi:YVTN repeat-like/Quino protein amine dehydrogenase [Piedraia hortae CBS 480.64]|uniref:YVTN repeat-like/Quino protein amine dehydrogenase n=1 Tax=Piedraia hortae CBS 480.64 TaxID=1314780 RepID=A0A6A7C0W1_9PEZI|nr:YVTN repeat-like/Quino protein amine dehydrogenase [Piedraia hortae CBS 480.64]
MPSMPEWMGRLKLKSKMQPFSTSNAATSQLSTPIPQAAHSTPQPSQSFQLHSTPVHASVAVVAPSNPFRKKSQLMVDALAKLPSDDRKFVEGQLGPNNDVARDVARIMALRGRNQSKRSNQYIVGMKKVACQIMQFAPVLDVATNIKTEVLSLPWAGIRSLLMVAQMSQEQSESILEGAEIALDTSYLLNVYFDVYNRLNGSPTIGHLYDNIAKLYGLILIFLAHAQSTSHARAVNFEASEEQRIWVNEQLEELKKAQREINDGVQGVQRTLDLSALPSATGAAYNSIDYRNHGHNGELQLCLSDTRICIRQTILNWATTANDQQIFWLSGKAGTGKSTIARTVAHELAKQGYLVGSFFFKRGQGELSDVCSLFPTLARQMADSIPTISDKIAAASHGSPPVKERPLTSQFDTLVEEPLSGYSTGLATDVRVIVIDALDECENLEAIGHAMTFWPKLGAHTSMNLRIFVTSRSDINIGAKLGQLGSRYLHHERLEHFQRDTIKHDLTMFCHDELRKLREASRNDLSYDELEDDWPGEVVVNKLVDISQPLFIAASTIFREVRNNPRKRLREWVDRLNFTETDALTVIYSDILKQAADLDNEWLQLFSQIIKPIALLNSPLTIPALTYLFGEGDDMAVPNALKPLSSVIEFPSGKEVKAGIQAPVRIYHESFRDFLVGFNDRGRPQFCIDKGETHGFVLRKCIDLLQKMLGRDVCKLKDPGTERKAVSAEHIQRHIPESVQGNDMAGKARGNDIEPEAVAKSHRSLAFAPSKSVIRSIFKHEMEDFLLVWPPVTTNWGPKLQTLRGHAEAILKIKPSTDGKRLVSTSRDRTVRLWDIESGTEEWRVKVASYKSTSSISEKGVVLIAGFNGELLKWSLEEGVNRVDLKLPDTAYCVSVSPKGRYSAWGLGRGGIFIKDVDNDTGELIKCHNSTVRCMVFSTDNELFSGSTEIWRWSTEAGNEMICQVGSDVEFLAVSPNSNLIVFWTSTSLGSSAGSRESSFSSHLGTVLVCRCDTRDVEWVMELKVQSFCFFTITPDNQQVLISAGEDVFLYDFETKRKPRIVFSERIYRTTMAFSPDGKSIWAGDVDGSVIQLDAELAMRSQLHRPGTAIISLSTDGRSLASWPPGNQLSLWNTETQVCKQWLSDERLSNLSDRLLLISSDSRFVVAANLSTPSDNAVLIWDPETTSLRQLRHKLGHISALTISPDSEILFCGLSDGQIWTFELKSGARSKTFLGHTSWIREIVFSPNERDFASVSSDDTTRIWNIHKQDPLLLSEDDFALPVSFSADGQKLYKFDDCNAVYEWDIEEASITRKLDATNLTAYYGSILFNGRFVHASYLPVLRTIGANEVDLTQTRADSLVTFRERDFLVLQLYLYSGWVTVDGRNTFKLPFPLCQDNWISCGRTIVVPNVETGFIVLKLTGKISF